eukprot:245126-Prymnesium_polylepis.1
MVCDSGRVVESWRVGRGRHTADSGRPCGRSRGALTAGGAAGGHWARAKSQRRWRVTGRHTCWSGQAWLASQARVRLLGEIHTQIEREREGVSERLSEL